MGSALAAAGLGLGTRKSDMCVVGDSLVPSPLLLFINLDTTAHGMVLSAFEVGIPSSVTGVFPSDSTSQ